MPFYAHHCMVHRVMYEKAFGKRGSYKKSRMYTEEQMQEAVELVLKGATMEGASNHFGGAIPVSTLCTRVQLHKKGLAARPVGHPTVLPLSDERWLAAWCKLLFKLGVPASRGRLFHKAREIAALRGIKFEEENGLPGTSWWTGFRRRHGLKMASTSFQARATAQALTPEALDGFYNLLFTILDDYRVIPALLWGCDETGICRARADQQFVVAPDGATRVKQTGTETGEHVTLLGAVSAIGDRMPPFVLRPGQGKRKTHNYLEGAPPGSVICHTRK